MNKEGARQPFFVVGWWDGVAARVSVPQNRNTSMGIPISGDGFADFAIKKSKIIYVVGYGRLTDRLTVTFAVN